MTPLTAPVQLDDCNTYELLHDGQDRANGLIWSHARPDGQWCAVNIPFRGHGRGMAEWTVVLEHPLTVTPALRCPACRARMWMDGGKGRAA